MNVSVFGLGYVGCVSAACLADDGHQVVGVDINPAKVDIVRRGQSPIWEPGLAEVISANVTSGRLDVTTQPGEAMRSADASLICVGTPSDGNGSLNLRYVEAVCSQIGSAIARSDRYHVVVLRSTVLPGTIEKRLLPILEACSGRQAGRGFGVCMNPEFLREGTAVADFYHPALVVLGQLDEASGDHAAPLYHKVEAPTVRTTLATAEMLKYTNNAFHALKVVFANEIGTLCKAHGVDGQDVMDLLCRDDQLNLSRRYLRPGFAYGGSCLPKDVSALVYRAKEVDVDCPLLAALPQSNRAHVERALGMVQRAGRKKVGVLGLSFKSGTDDVRESPAVALIETLHGRGYEVSVYDHRVDPDRLIGTNRTFLERELPHIASMMRSSAEDLVADAETLVITQDDEAFQGALSRVGSHQLVIDLVGSLRKRDVEGDYQGIGW